MPVYEYQCPACGVFEESHSLADNPRIVPCPQCHADAPKIISAVLGRSTSTSTRTLGNVVDYV